MISLVHFNLLDPIMVGKKKTQDVQFYTEVMDSVQTLEGGRRSMYDPDEIEEEQREREMRNKARRCCYRLPCQISIWPKPLQNRRAEQDEPAVNPIWCSWAIYGLLFQRYAQLLRARPVFQYQLQWVITG